MLAHALNPSSGETKENLEVEVSLGYTVTAA